MHCPLLDLGCGEGIFTEILFKDQIETGLDPQNRELSRAKDFGKYHELLQEFGNKVPKPDGFYRTILSNSVLEHIPDLIPVLKEAHRILAQDGDFYITVPTNYFDEYSIGYRLFSCLGLKGAAKWYKGFFNNFWAHYHFYDVDGWYKMLTSCGFEIVESRQYCTKTQGTFNDLMAPFSLLSFVQKKFFNKWFVIPQMRKISASALAVLFRGLSNPPAQTDRGGIVFFHLRKKR